MKTLPDGDVVNRKKCQRRTRSCLNALTLKCLWGNQVEIASRNLNSPASNSLKERCSQVIVVETVFLALRVSGEKRRREAEGHKKNQEHTFAFEEIYFIPVFDSSSTRVLTLQMMNLSVENGGNLEKGRIENVCGCYCRNVANFIITTGFPQIQFPHLQSQTKLTKVELTHLFAKQLLLLAPAQWA